MRALVFAPLLLAGCTGLVPALFMGGRTVEVGGDVYAVQVRSNEVRLSNYSTGIGNQDRLFANAGLAAVEATGCPLESLTQDPTTNSYTAVMDCD